MLDHASRQAQRRGISRENLVLPNRSSLADARPRGTIMSRKSWRSRPKKAALMIAVQCPALAGHETTTNAGMKEKREWPM